MSNKKAIFVISIAVLAVCIFGFGPWLVDGFRNDDWVTLNHVLAMALIITVCIGTLLVNMSNGVVMTVFALALGIALIDISLEIFDLSGFIPNPFKMVRGEMSGYYKIVASEGEPRALAKNYIVVVGLTCLLVTIKWSRRD